MKKPVRYKMIFLAIAIMTVAVQAGPVERERELLDDVVDDSNNTSIPADIAIYESRDQTAPTYGAYIPKSITCAYFDQAECKNAGKCNVTTKTCYSKPHLLNLKCLAVWDYPKNVSNNSTEKFMKVADTMIKKLDCFAVQQDNDEPCLFKDKCQQHPIIYDENDEYQRDIGDCCCNTPHCNYELWQWNHEVGPPRKSNVEQTTATDLFKAYWYLMLALLVILVAAIIVVGYVYCKVVRKEQKNQRIRNCVAVEPACVIEEAQSAPLVKHEVIEMVEKKPKEFPITDFLLISKGRFGQVYRAKWTDPDGEERLVAVKKLALSERKNYMEEKKIFDIMVSLPRWYANILQFVGADQIGDEYWIVTEFHERLSLHDLLVKNTVSITSANRLILTMIDGLQFLHDERPFLYNDLKPPIIHRDIKSKNILVKSDMTTCIADFGLARVFRSEVKDGDLLGQVGTRRYMSPEMLEGALEFNALAFKALDIYSLALVIWEVICRTKLHKNDVVPEYELPYNQLGFNPSIGYMRNHVVVKKERPQFREATRAHDYVGQLVLVCEEMWDPQAYARLTAGCAFSRVWDIINSQMECSEGYHSGGSAKDGEEGEKGKEKEGKEYKPQKKGSDDMAEYHASVGTLPHPTPDPFKDHCPDVPPIPNLTGESVDIQQPPAGMPIRLEDDEESEEMVERIYDMEKDCLLTPEEVEEQVEEVNTRASTPTPSGTF